MTDRYSAFVRMHPLTNMLYIAAVLTLTMITLNPFMLAVSFVASMAYGLYLGGAAFVKKNAFISVGLTVFAVLVQPLFTHSGSTPLFYINDNAVSLENVVYGAAMSVLIVSVIQWCSCAALIMSSEKMMYLFGRAIPSAGMIFSMILRLVPLMRRRYRQIHEASQGIYMSGKNTIFEKIRHFTRDISVLVSWSLENSMETSMSMESRGYGLKGRTSYTRFHVTTRDIVMMATNIILFVISFAQVAADKLLFYYLPEIYSVRMDAGSVVGIAAFVIMALMPLVVDMVQGAMYAKRCAWNEE